MDSTLKFLQKLVCITLILPIFFLNLNAYAHDGHVDEDMVIKDLNDLGTVNFSTSCNQNAQSAINTGVALLHHMMYAQAELLFNQWTEKAPDCAMMYWGYSMSLFHPLWPDKIKDEALIRGQIALNKAQQLIANKREKSYIDAAAQYYADWNNAAEKQRLSNWAMAQKKVFEHNPQDIDAAAFYALSQLVIASKKDPSFKQNKEVGALLAKFHAISPTHPGAIHYSIHAYDNPLLARLAIDVARAYDKIAPDVPHALHMPSHIFVRLGMWNDVVNWNLRSADAALKYPSNGSTSIHYVHAMDYLIYGYLQLGEGNKAKLALQMMESHHPIQDAFPAAYALTVIPARLALEQKNWLQASQIKTQQPSYISWQKFPQIEAITYFARGIGAARNGDLKAAQENLLVLDELYERTKKTSPDYWALLVEAQRKTVSAWINFGAGNKAEALVQLREAADLEDSIDKNPVTPGAVLPARELLADMLYLTGDSAAALEAYKSSLAISPNRFYSVSGADHIAL